MAASSTNGSPNVSASLAPGTGLPGSARFQTVTAAPLVTPVRPSGLNFSGYAPGRVASATGASPEMSQRTVFLAALLVATVRPSGLIVTATIPAASVRAASRAGCAGSA